MLQHDPETRVGAKNFGMELALEVSNQNLETTDQLVDGWRERANIGGF
jgi:hypothetical protein